MEIRLRYRILALAVLLAFIGCGKQQSSESSAALPNVDASTAGSISGKVVFEGAPPVLKPIDMSANQACLQLNPRPVIPPVVTVGEQSALADVVVYVKSGLAKYKFDAPATPAILAQKNCMYQPHVMALMVGQPFAVENQDPTMHNVHPMPKHNRQWSNSQPAGSAALRSTFERPEFAMPVLCNVHPWMRAFVFVFDHPYFAVTTPTGNFALNNVPPGTYTIGAWHENYPTEDQTITIAPKESKTIVFTFK